MSGSNIMDELGGKDDYIWIWAQGKKVDVDSMVRRSNDPEWKLLTSTEEATSYNNAEIHGRKTISELSVLPGVNNSVCLHTLA